MIGIEKFFFALGVLYAVVVLPGCTTTETDATTQASSVSSASTESVAVSVATETTTATHSATLPQPASPAVDVLSDMKKPCGTVAADAPKFVEPETMK